MYFKVVCISVRESERFWILTAGKAGALVSKCTLREKVLCTPLCQVHDLDVLSVKNDRSLNSIKNQSTA